MQEKPVVFGIFSKILFAMLLVAVVPMLAVWYLNYLQAMQSAQVQVKQRLQGHATRIGGHVDDWVEMNRRMLLQNASLADMASMKGSRQNPLLESIPKSYEWTYLAFTVRPDGANVGRSDGKPLKFYGDRQYVQQVLEGEPLGSQVLIGKTSGKPALVLAAPIKGRGESVKGVIAIAMTIGDLTRSVADTRIGETGFAFLLDQTGHVVVHPSDEYTLTRKDLSAHPALVALAEGQDRVIFEDGTGQKTVALPTRTAQGWVVVAQQDYSEAFAGIAETNRNAMILLAVTLAAVFLVALFFSRRLASPIRNLTRVADQLSKGQLDMEIAEVGRRDEIGALARSIDRLGASIKYAMERIRKAKKQAA